MTTIFSKIFRRKLVLAGALASGLFPLSAFSSWSCTSQGKTYTFNTQSYCASQLDSYCEPLPDQSGYCAGGMATVTNATTVPPPATTTTQTTTTVATTTGPATGSTTTAPAATNAMGTSIMNMIIGPYATNNTGTGTTATNNTATNTTVTDTPAQPVIISTALDTQPAAVTQDTGSTVSNSQLDTSTANAAYIAQVNQQKAAADLSARAAAENRIAIGEAEKLQGQMQEFNVRHNDAVSYYRSPGAKDPLIASRFFSSGTRYSAGTGSDLSGALNTGGPDGSNSDVSGARNPDLVDSTNSVAMSTGGKSPNKKSSKGASSAGGEFGLSAEELAALKKASKAELVAKLLKDSSLKDKVKKMLADGEGNGDGDMATLAAALAQAEDKEAAADGKTAAGESGGKGASNKVAANGNRLTLEDMDTQREVGRLLASFGGDSNAAAFDSISESLFVRAHSAHTRSLERGNVLSKLRRR